MKSILKFLFIGMVILTSSVIAQNYYDEYGNLVQPGSQTTALTTSRSARSISSQQSIAVQARSAQNVRQVPSNRQARSARSVASQPALTDSRSAQSVRQRPSNRQARSARGIANQSISSRSAISSQGVAPRTSRSIRGRSAVNRSGGVSSQTSMSSRAGVANMLAGSAPTTSTTVSQTSAPSSVSTATTVLQTSTPTTAVSTATTTTVAPINYAELIPTSTVNTTGKTAEEVVILLGNEKSCKEQYIKCMDPLCSDSDTESKIGRCLCSGSISAQSTKEKELNKILANISQMQWQSKNLELAKSKSDLDGTDFDYALEEVTEEALVQLGVTDAKSATDDDIFEVFLGDVTEKTVRKEGNAKLQEANKTCQTTLEICPDSKKLIVDSYAILAGNDCRVYSTDLEKKIFENKIVLQNAYNQYQMKGTEYNIKTKNKMNSQECATALTSCMKSEDICGLTYEFCATDGDLEGKKALCSSVLNQCQQANNPTLPKGEKRTAATTDVLWKSFKTNALSHSKALNTPIAVAPIIVAPTQSPPAPVYTSIIPNEPVSKPVQTIIEPTTAPVVPVVVVPASIVPVVVPAPVIPAPIVEILPTPTVAEKSVLQISCEGSEGTWTNNTCACKNGLKSNGICKTNSEVLQEKQTECNSKTNFQWVNNTCSCKAGFELVGEKCSEIVKTETTTLYSTTSTYTCSRVVAPFGNCADKSVAPCPPEYTLLTGSFDRCVIKDKNGCKEAWSSVSQSCKLSYVNTLKRDELISCMTAQCILDKNTNVCKNQQTFMAKKENCKQILDQVDYPELLWSMYLVNSANAFKPYTEIECRAMINKYTNDNCGANNVNCSAEKVHDIKLQALANTIEVCDILKNSETLQNKLRNEINNELEQVVLKAQQAILQEKQNIINSKNAECASILWREGQKRWVPETGECKWPYQNGNIHYYLDRCMRAQCRDQRDNYLCRNMKTVESKKENCKKEMEKVDYPELFWKNYLSSVSLGNAYKAYSEAECKAMMRKYTNDNCGINYIKCPLDTIDTIKHQASKEAIENCDILQNNTTLQNKLWEELKQDILKMDKTCPSNQVWVSSVNSCKLLNSDKTVYSNFNICMLSTCRPDGRYLCRNEKELLSAKQSCSSKLSDLENQESFWEDYKKGSLGPIYNPYTQDECKVIVKNIITEKCGFAYAGCKNEDQIENLKSSVLIYATEECDLLKGNEALQNTFWSEGKEAIVKIINSN